MFFSYFVAESGTRLSDGNFLWSGQMAAFVRAELARERLWPGLARGVIVAIVLAVHVESGIRDALVKLEPLHWARWWI